MRQFVAQPIEAAVPSLPDTPLRGICGESHESDSPYSDAAMVVPKHAG